MVQHGSLLSERVVEPGVGVNLAVQLLGIAARGTTREKERESGTLIRCMTDRARDETGVSCSPEL